jgi:heme A synthase
MATSAHTPSAAPAGSVAAKWPRQLAWFTLAWNMAVVLWGAYVRESGSGAGCGARWPLCNGVVLPHAAQIATLIEFFHRASSGIAFCLVVVTAVTVFYITGKHELPAGRAARWSAGASVFLILNEALLGALLVLLHLVEQNRSPLRAVYLCLHSTNTLLLLGALALVAWSLGRHAVPARKSRLHRPRNGIAFIGLLATIVVAATGSIAALGDTLFPATSLHQAIAQDFAHNSFWALRLRVLHPICAVLMGIYLLWLMRGVAKPSLSAPAPRSPLRAMLTALWILLAAQYLLGVLDVVLLAPLWLQILHLFIGDVFWILLVLVTVQALPNLRGGRTQWR